MNKETTKILFTIAFILYSLAIVILAYQLKHSTEQCDTYIREHILPNYNSTLYSNYYQHNITKETKPLIIYPSGS